MRGLTFDQWFQFGGYWAAFIVVVVSCKLIVQRNDDERAKKDVLPVLIAFGWIPVGCVAIFIESLWADPPPPSIWPTYAELAGGVESGDPAKLAMLRSKLIEARERADDEQTEQEFLHDTGDMR